MPDDHLHSLPIASVTHACTTATLPSLQFYPQPPTTYHHHAFTTDVKCLPTFPFYYNAINAYPYREYSREGKEKKETGENERIEGATEGIE